MLYSCCLYFKNKYFGNLWIKNQIQNSSSILWKFLSLPSNTLTNIYTAVDLWTTQVWNAWIHLPVDFFVNNKHYRISRGLVWWLTWSIIGLQYRRPRFDPWVRKIPWRKEWQLTPVFLPGEFYGQRSLVGYSPWGHRESGMTEQLTLTSLHSTSWPGVAWKLHEYGTWNREKPHIYVLLLSSC